VKHKKSNKKVERIQLKSAKNEAKLLDQNTIEMNDSTVVVEGTNEGTQQPQEPLTDEIKMDLKLQRKKLNASKNAYKRMVPKTKHFS
jgi:hypothetical protein